MKKLLLVIAFSMFAFGQSPPVTPAVSTVRGVGVPPGNTCNVPGQYGNQWFDTTSTSDLYTCGSTGWVKHTGGGSSLTPCGPTVGEVQLYASSSALGCDALFFYDTTNHALRFGLAEPDLSNQDGPSNSFSVVHNFPSGGYNLSNFVAAGASMAGDGAANFLDFYSSNGTVSAPTNATATTIMWGLTGLTYLGGSYQYLASINAFVNLSGAGGSLGGATSGTVEQSINTIDSSELGHTYLWSPDGIAVEFAIVNAGGPPTGIGFEPISAGVGEFNNGTPSSVMGGALAQLNLGQLQIKGLTTGAATGKHVACIDPTSKQIYESSTGTDCSN